MRVDNSIDPRELGTKKERPDIAEYISRIQVDPSINAWIRPGTVHTEDRIHIDPDWGFIEQLQSGGDIIVWVAPDDI